MLDVAGMADISVVTLAHARTRTYPAHQKSINKRVKCRCGHVRHFVALGGGGGRDTCLAAALHTEIQQLLPTVGGLEIVFNQQ